MADPPLPLLPPNAGSAPHRPSIIPRLSYDPNFPWERYGLLCASAMRSRWTDPRRGCVHRRNSSSANSFVTGPTGRQESSHFDRDRWASASSSTSAGNALNEMSIAPSGLRTVPIPERLTSSCNSCRQRKTRCDGNPPRPCGPCTNRGAEDECSYVTTVRRHGPGKLEPTIEEQSLEHPHREGMVRGHGALRRTYTVDSGMPEDRHGVTRRREADMLLPGREKRTRTTSPESERASRPVSGYQYDGDQDR